MSSFFLIGVIQKDECTSIKESYIERGFGEPIEVNTKAGLLWVYPRLNGEQTWYQEERGFLAVCGSLWYNEIFFPDCGNALLNDLSNNSLEKQALSGTFTLIWVDSNLEVSIFHDYAGINRFYIDYDFNILSSSFLSLAWLRCREMEEVNDQALFENMLLGFNLGTKTWLKSVERVQSQSQLSSIENLSYQRGEFSNLSNKVFSYKEEIRRSVEILKTILNEKIKSYSGQPVLGLSSGFDSRLVAASISPDLVSSLSFFTFHKPGDKDPVIAEQVASAMDLPLRKIESNPPLKGNARVDVFRRAFLFFDGQCAVMMRYSKEDYTREYRDLVFRSGELHISGVGGELFRNYNHDHRLDLKLEFWLNHYYSAGMLSEWLLDDSLLKTTMEEIKQRLNIDGNKISYIQRKKFYGDVFLNDWHGMRNSIENQHTPYYSPFTEPAIIAQSYNTIFKQGYQGQFEADMIRKLSPELAAISSEYGHTMNMIPLSIRFKAFIRASAKTPAFARGRNIYSSKKRKVSKIHRIKTSIFDEVFKERIDMGKLALIRPELLETANYALVHILQK